MTADRKEPMRDPKDEKRAADQDTAAEIAFVAGKLPEEDRRKAAAVPHLVPPPVAPPPVARPTTTPFPRKQPSASRVGTFIALAIGAVLVLVAVGFCR